MLKSWILLIGMFLLLLVGTANAALTTIGTATYQGADYKLIWDDDNNGNSVVWLDYTNSGDSLTWLAQTSWAAELGSTLTNIQTPGYNISWNDGAWRLPSAGPSPGAGYSDSYYQTNSEMGHLFYTELELSLSMVSTALLNQSNFDNLSFTVYWSETTYAANSDWAWYYAMNVGYQGQYRKTDENCYGLAIRNAQVTYDPVPIPGAIILLGAGFIGLVGLRRKSLQ